MVDKHKSKHKVIAQGAFFTYAITVTDPMILLPLLISFFSDSYILIGLFISLYKASGIFVQHYSAYKIQAYPYAMKGMSSIFLLRLFSWLLIGLSIIIFGEDHPSLTLLLIALGLILFSISYSVGEIFYNEILGKVFTRSFRGVTLARRQFFAAIGLFLAAITASLIFPLYPQPINFGILFLLSTFIMSIGLYIFTTINEPKKKNARTDTSFKNFLNDTLLYIKADSRLRNYLLSYFLSLSYLLSLPYIIIQSSDYLEITGLFVGELILFQTLGLLIGNTLWANLSKKNKEKTILLISIFLLILLFVFALNISSVYYFYIIFFLYGFASDGIKLVYTNTLFQITKEDRRPIYTSLKAHITSLAFLLPILGGVIISLTSINFIYSLTLFILTLNFLYIVQKSTFIR